MGARTTKLSALECVHWMREYNYTPKTIINAGVGQSYEFEIWQWLFPHAYKIGIDPFGQMGRWGGQKVWKALGSKEGNTWFCGNCRTIHCKEHMDRQRSIEVTTIDKLKREFCLKHPFFMWMDCEGSELEVLKGAEHTLRYTRFLSMEMREFSETNNQYVESLRKWLKEHGFDVLYTLRNGDYLYINKKWEEN